MQRVGGDRNLALEAVHRREANARHRYLYTLLLGVMVQDDTGLLCCGTEAGSYLRLIDSCITQLKAQGPSRTCNASKEEEECDGSGRHGAVEPLRYEAHGQEMTRFRDERELWCTDASMS